MSSLGVYFGTNSIGLAEVNKKKLVNNVVIQQASMFSGDFEEKVPTDVKIIALIKDALRTNHINVDHGSICISGQDLIIRTFEIPKLPSNELQSAINFEAKKYIPFKLEDLVFNFQVEFDQKNKLNTVLFVGIKKEILEKYISISKQLNIKINAIEYSAFSLLRFLRLCGAKDSGVVASLCFDLNNEDEINFMVSENGFPFFSRDIVLTSGLNDLDASAVNDQVKKYDKLKNEIRVSQDYYRRKFPDKGIKTLYVLSGQDMREDLSNFFAGSGILAKFVDTSKILGKGATYSSILAKSVGAVLFKELPLKIKINLYNTRLKADSVKGKEDIFAFMEGVKIDFRVIFLAILICAATFGYGIYRIQPVREELNSIKDKRPKVASASAGEDYAVLAARDKNLKKKLNNLDNLIKNQLYATYFLDILPRALPEGAWLTKFTSMSKEDGRPEVILEGEAYLGDSDKEFEAVSTFLSNLKGNQFFSKNFKEITITSVDRKTIWNKSVAIFSIACRNYPEKKRDDNDRFLQQE
ncbi:MAG: pilus assembly protein PilM [Candidatus Omnitrophica bacterium]|nr:pilus assembly protein PilM [Candidatus Omnitrophota bacterium]MBU1922865.1 pilus assembly protein PilM [Candidatus Omnitrophota bacterium]